MKHIVIAGCRAFSDYEHLSKVISNYLRSENIDDILFITGGCRGADMLGERYAKKHGFPYKRYLPQWKKYGRAAGPIRNCEMANESDIVICFWDKKKQGHPLNDRICKKIR